MPDTRENVSAVPARARVRSLLRAARPLLLGQAVFLAVMGLALGLTRFVAARDDEEALLTLERQVQGLRNQLEQELSDRASVLEQAVSFWLFSESVTRSEFRGYAHRLLQRQSRFHHLLIAMPDERGWWREPTRVSSDEPPEPPPALLLELALNARGDAIGERPRLSPVYPLGLDGPLAFALVAPIFKAGDFQGSLVGEILLESLLTLPGRALTEIGIHVRLRELPGGTLRVQQGLPPRVENPLQARAELRTLGAHWLLEAEQLPPSLAPTPARLFLQGGGLLFATLLGISVTLLSSRKERLRRSQHAVEQRARELEEVNHRLAESDARNRQTILELEQANQRLQAARDELAVGNDRLASLNRALETANQKLRVLNHELDDFNHIISHDLKEPLRGIQAFGQFLEEDYADSLDETARSYLQSIKSAAERMKALIDDLMKLATITQGRTNKQRVSLQRSLEQVQRTLAFSILERGVEFELPEELPEVWCDPTQAQIVLTNLISNAIKYNTSEIPRIKLSWYHEEPLVVVEIHDNGIGIDPRYHERIFGLFERLFAHEQYEGTGAGLAIVKRIVEQHGGRIWLRSAPNVGSTFSFSMPVPPPDQTGGGDRQDSTDPAAD